MAGANVHQPDHDRDKTDQDDAGSKYSGEEAVDSFGGDYADHQPSEDVALTRKRLCRGIVVAGRWRREILPRIVRHASRVTQVGHGDAAHVPRPARAAPVSVRA